MPDTSCQPDSILRPLQGETYVRTVMIIMQRSDFLHASKTVYPIFSFFFLVTLVFARVVSNYCGDASRIGVE